MPGTAKNGHPTAEKDDELVATAEAHMRDTHPEMVGTLSREQVLAMATEA